MSAPARIQPAEDRVAAVGIVYMLAAVFLFTFAIMLVKWSATTYSIVQIVFFRNLFALPPMALLLWANGGVILLRTRHPLSHLYRGAVGFTSMMLVFYALTMLPLAEATALSFTAPIFMTALSMPLLGERVGIYRWSAVAIGFLGVVIITRPGQAVFSLGAFAALGSAFAYALSIISVRGMSRIETPITIASFYTIICTLLAGVALPFNWTPPSLLDLAILATIGVASGVAQYLQTQAFRLAPVAVIGPFNYLGIIFAALFGYLIWNEIPGPSMVVGSTIVVACGLFILYREAVRGSGSRPSRR